MVKGAEREARAARERREALECRLEELRDAREALEGQRMNAAEYQRAKLDNVESSLRHVEA
jgi:hypothetical protein